MTTRLIRLITRGQLSSHADRGSSMTSKPVALLLADLGVTQSHSRPHVSNDNRTPRRRPGRGPERIRSERSRSWVAERSRRPLSYLS
jgi:transposase InsO family protein